VCGIALIMGQKKLCGRMMEKLTEKVVHLTELSAKNFPYTKKMANPKVI
jgi:hypothetical protein